jgi:hypothetical protein
MWIKLKSVQYISQNGRLVKHIPGEWIQVGKQTALNWIAANQAERPDMPQMNALPGCGIVSPNKARVKALFPSMEVKGGRPELAFPRTLCWDPAAKLRGELLGTGFQMLDTWEVAAPLASYETLARDIGTPAERSLTEAVIRDLRVPFYEARVLFMKRCPTTRELMAAWEEERLAAEGNGSRVVDERLAFLRALYRVKPLVLALPVTWVLG